MSSGNSQPLRRRARVTGRAARIVVDVSTIFSMTWDTRAGEVIPKSEDVALENGAVKLQAVIL